MSDLTINYGLEKPLGSENYDVQVQNRNMDNLDAKLKAVDNKASNITVSVTKVNNKTGDVVLTASDVGAIPSIEKGAVGGVASYDAVASSLADMTYQLATGTATALLVIMPTLVDGYTKTFIASATNASTAKTINGKAFYKPGTVLSPSLTIGKAYTVWYNLASNCFFIKASAEGNSVVGDVLAGKTFSNDQDTGLIGTLALTGNALATDIVLGKTAYNTDAKVLITGTNTKKYASTDVILSEDLTKVPFGLLYTVVCNDLPASTIVRALLFGKVGILVVPQVGALIIRKYTAAGAMSINTTIPSIVGTNFLTVISDETAGVFYYFADNKCYKIGSDCLLKATYTLRGITTREVGFDRVNKRFVIVFDDNYVQVVDSNFTEVWKLLVNAANVGIPYFGDPFSAAIDSTRNVVYITDKQDTGGDYNMCRYVAWNIDTNSIVWSGSDSTVSYYGDIAFKYNAMEDTLIYVLNVYNHSAPVTRVLVYYMNKLTGVVASLIFSTPAPGGPMVASNKMCIRNGAYAYIAGSYGYYTRKIAAANNSIAVNNKNVDIEDTGLYVASGYATTTGTYPSIDVCRITDLYTVIR